MSVSRGSHFFSAFGLALALALAGQARAAETSTVTLTNGGTNLVPGGAPAPEFHMDFMLNNPAGGAQGSSQNLEVSMPTTNNATLRMLFSPRPQFGVGVDPISGTNRAYAALTWNWFNDHSLYGNFGVGGSFDQPAIAGTDPTHGAPLAPLMFHSAVEFGYSFSGQNSVSFSVDQGVVPRSSGAEPVDNFMLRYGLKF